MLIKTSALIDATLDWATAKAEGLLRVDGGNLSFIKGGLRAHDSTFGEVYQPSQDASVCKKISERENIVSRPCAVMEYGSFQAIQDGWRNAQIGPTHLVAILRCLVASKLGEEVDIPEELL